MPVHDWTRVNAGTFHDFHNSWIVHLKEALNGGMLPEGFYALSEQHAGTMIPDVLTLQRAEEYRLGPQVRGPIALAEAPPKVSMVLKPSENAAYRMRRKSLVIRHASGHRIVALLEIASSANKDRGSSVEQFVDKMLAAMRAGIHLLVADLHPPGTWDPLGMHGSIWEAVAGQDYSPPAGKPLTLASYLMAHEFPEAYVEPIAVGDALPDMPLFLDPDWYVNVPLERTYQEAYAGIPAIWRKVIEGS